MAIRALSSRNQIKGRIQEIASGDVLSDVAVATAGGVLTATLNTRSIKEMGLHVGSEVLVLIKESRVAVSTN